MRRNIPKDVLEEAGKPQGAISSVEYQDLPCDLTEEEVLAYAQEQAAKLSSLMDLERERKHVATNYKARIDLLKSEVVLLTDKIKNRKEERNVMCSIQRDYQAGCAHICRTDTGELIITRPLTPQERQLRMELYGRQAAQTGANPEMHETESEAADAD